MLIILPLIGTSVYLFNTEDSSSIEFYDCAYNNDISYCCRPFDPISLYKNDSTHQCYHDGISHSFIHFILIVTPFGISIQRQMKISRIEKWFNRLYTDQPLHLT